MANPQWIEGVTRKMHLECEFLLSFKYMCETVLKLLAERKFETDFDDECNINRSLDAMIYQK